jgi:hypothetical protein
MPALVYKNIFVPMPLFLRINCIPTIHVKPIYKKHCYVSPENVLPGGILNQAFGY